MSVFVWMSLKIRKKSRIKLNQENKKRIAIKFFILLSKLIELKISTAIVG